MKESERPPLDEQIEIFVDHRERGAGVSECLARRADVLAVVVTLACGDYSIGGVIGFERKTGGDFAKSVIDGRLFPQMASLRREYARPILLLEEFTPGDETFGVPWPALRGAFVSVAVVFGVPVIFSSRPEESAEIIVAAGRQIRRCVQNARNGYPRPGYRPKGWRKRALYILQGLPGVGPKRAGALIESFQSAGAVFSGDEETLRKVSGVGRLVARRIRASLEKNPAWRPAAGASTPAGRKPSQTRRLPP